MRSLVMALGLVTTLLSGQYHPREPHHRGPSFQGSSNFREHLPNYRLYFHRGSRFFYSRGFWYIPWEPGYLEVYPPIGLYVEEIPLDCEIVMWRGIVFFKFNDIYYNRSGEGYIVAKPPFR